MTAGRAAVVAALTALALGGCGSQQAGTPAPAPTTPAVGSASSTTPSTGSSTSPTTSSAAAPVPGTSPGTRSTLPTLGVGRPPTSGPPVTMRGVPTEGVDPWCHLLGGYLLMGDDPLLSAGRKITVVGHTESDLMTTCQQGRPLVVDRVSAPG